MSRKTGFLSSFRKTVNWNLFLIFIPSYRIYLKEQPGIIPLDFMI